MANFAVAPSSSNQGVLIDSTTGLLTNNATYTSNGYRIISFARVTGLINSDQTGTLHIDQSADGTNWDYVTTVAITGGTVAAFSVEVIAEWVRIRFTNSGGSTQTTMRLYTYARAV